jgi:hypothetical protein
LCEWKIVEVKISVQDALSVIQQVQTHRRRAAPMGASALDVYEVPFASNCLQKILVKIALSAKSSNNR